MITIAVANQKGGVGKTTITFNLAKILSSRGRNTLAIDNDPQANLTSSLLENRAELRANVSDVYAEKPLSTQLVSKNLHLVGSDISLAAVAERDFEVIYRLREALEPFREDNSPLNFDYVLIDCLPSVGYLHIAALNAADYVLIPMKPSPYALAGMNDLISTIKKARKRLNRNLKILGILLNQVDGRKPILERQLESVLRQNYGELVFRSKLNKRIRFEESPALQKGIIEYKPKGSAAEEFKSFTRELLKRVRNNDNLGSGQRSK